jgi:hypothetical protein
VKGGDLLFRLPRQALLLYSILALLLSLGLVLLSQQRGPREAALWLVAYVGIALLSLRLPGVAPLAAGAAAFLLGFVKTYRSGVNLDLGLGLIALSTGLYVLDRWRRSGRSDTVDLAGMLLFLIAVWSTVSLGFSLFRIGSFTPAPGFSFRWYRFNPAGHFSDEVMIRALVGGTTAFLWFGLYEFGRAVRLERKALNVLVFLLLLANGMVLLVQRHVDPAFLHPIGFQPLGRLNGLTSFCYSLGDVTLALFLLLPVWGATRGLAGLLTGGSLVLLAHAMVASGSRTAVFAALAATLLWASVRVGRLFLARRRLAASLLLAAVALLPCLVAMVFWLTPPGQATPFGRLKWELQREGALSNPFAARLSSYPLIFRVLREYPLSGVGVGLYPAEAGKQHALLAPEIEILEPYLLSSFAPNQLLNTGVELGVPALVALVGALVFAAWKAVPRRGAVGSADLAVSLLVLVLAIQLGPSFNNSEALVFFWLIIGLAARAGEGPDGTSNDHSHRRDIGPRGASAVVVGALVLGATGQLLALPELAIDRQWRLLRWPMNMGMMDTEEDGRWTAPEATFTVQTSARELVVRWHAGDRGLRDYSAVVSFYVDGELVERSVARPGRIRESVLPLPAVPGFKRVSVRVSPPFVPAETTGGEDRRELGIFIHSVRSVTEAAPEAPS